MPRKIDIKPCACGCGTLTKGAGRFLPGHDQRLRIAIENHLGGLEQLREFVERKTQRPIEAD